MARLARHFLKFPSPAYYHLICHLQDELPYLRPSDKEYLLRLLRKLTSVFALRLISYALLGNHFHLLVLSEGEEGLGEAEAVERALRLYSPGVVFSRSGTYWRRRLSDISHFMKELNQRFSQRYNLLHRRRGHVFYDRFKSILVDGEAALAVSLYIELNAVRAGLTKSVSGYRWVSYAERRASSGDWLMSLEDTFGIGLGGYGKLLEEVGRIEREGKGRVEEDQRGIVAQVLTYRCEGLVYGSVLFVEEILRRLPRRRRRRAEAGGFVLA